MSAVADRPVPLDVARLRADFPILAQRINGKPLVYLDNGASSQRPRAVIDAERRYAEEMHVGVHLLGVAAVSYTHLTLPTILRV